MSWLKAGNIRGVAGEPGRAGESLIGPQGEPGATIAAIERDGPRLFIELDDGRRFDAGEIVGPRGDKGDNGIGLAGAVIDRAGNLVVTFSNGVSQQLGLVVGRDGEPGVAGKDGLGFDDLEILHDGERSFTFRLARGDAVKEWHYSVPAQIYRGVHKDGERYERGDTATWGGSLYHCNEPTTEKPGGGSAAWTLVAKRGQDGKDGKPGAKGDPGAPGRPGKDLTQMGPDGAKW